MYVQDTLGIVCMIHTYYLYILYLLAVMLGFGPFVLAEHHCCRGPFPIQQYHIPTAVSYHMISYIQTAVVVDHRIRTYAGRHRLVVHTLPSGKEPPIGPIGRAIGTTTHASYVARAAGEIILVA